MNGCSTPERVPGLKQKFIKDRKRHRKSWEEAFRKFPQWYELTEGIKLVYAKETSFDTYNGFPMAGVHWNHIRSDFLLSQMNIPQVLL
ncbi:hypothetical protein [Enterococcus ratti]